MKVKILKKYAAAVIASGFFLCGIGAVSKLHAQQPDYLIIPGTKVGAITRASSEADLKRIYGARNVRRTQVSLGEGEYAPGTVIFAGDSSKIVKITWKDDRRRRFPQQIFLTAATSAGFKSVWKTRHGIRLGTSLPELERLNGKPFLLSGFGWDYAGTIYSWEGGKLQRDLGRERDDQPEKIYIRLDTGNFTNLSQEEANSVTGDIEISSSNPIMRRLNPRIYEIIVAFP